MSGMTKAERLNEMKRLYMQRAYSDIQMAERLGVSRETVFRDRVALTEEEHYPIEKNADGLYFMNRSKLLSEIKVSLHEALALYLAARKTSRQTYFRHTHAISAMEKLAAILYKPMAEKLLKATDVALRQEENSERIRIIEDITQGWAERREVRIEYKALGESEPKKHTLRPYLIEPSIWSDSVYVIAHSDKMKTVAPFKIERISHTFLSGATFELPDDFDEEVLLKHAWGIWYQDKAPVTVKLRFNKRAAQRVKESKWHPLEKVEDTEDDGCIWQADLAEWQEMLPWIRGWGADVEVLEPEALKKELRSETQKLMKIYLANALTQTIPAYHALWAKAQKKDTYHPLLYHLIDVGMCAKMIWDTALPDGEKNYFAKAFPADISTAALGNFFAFLAATHDLGKASPSFQERHKESIERIKEAGYPFFKRLGKDPIPHGIISTKILPPLFESELGLDKDSARFFAHAVGGHHGLWTNSGLVQRLNSNFDLGDETWENARLELVQELKKIFQPPLSVNLPEGVETQNAILTFFSGLVTAADWLGSDERYFPYEDFYLSSPEYAEGAKSNAQKALDKTGWSSSAWNPNGQRKSFAEMFGYLGFETPRQIQAQVIKAAEQINTPCLLILEAPTGLGKTETALYLADQWLQTQKGRGIYIAMPTQATSNQIFARTVDFLKNRYPDEQIHIQLAHGQAQWNDIMQELTSIGDADNDDEKMHAEAWFLPSKRTLLAPFGVGTVDQALMATLQTRHFFLRLFGLAGKVVIFDEVHAYDTYMESLFLRLLNWLRVLGTSVIVLSATLPEQVRREMVTAYGGTLPDEREQAAYPRLTLVEAGQTRSLALDAPEDRTIHLAWLDPNPEKIADAIAEKIQNGGCVAVICNTVKRAQEIYEYLKTANLVPEDELLLFHSRFPPAWRKKIEDKVLEKFGKNKENRPEKSIVVATQVIEQSLDLDFDLMVSDLAPMDLLIQRIGRLHRHARDERPLGLAAPQMLIAQPEGDSHAPQFGASGYVYAPYILWRTWLAIEGRTELRLPGETPTLIEAVYGEHDPENDAVEIRDSLAAAYQKMQKDFGFAGYKADQNLIFGPDREKLVTQRMQALKDDDNPLVHEQIKAATRLIPSNVNLVCLHKMTDGSLNVEPDGSGRTINLDNIPSKEDVPELLQHTVAVQRQDIVSRLATKTRPKWQKKAALRYHVPIIFERGRYPIEGTALALTLDAEFGLEVKDKETL